MVGIRTAALITVVLIAARSARAAERFPFEVKNGRGASGLVFSVAADAAAPTRWLRTVRIVGTEDAVVSTERLSLAGEIDVETEAGDIVKLTPSDLPPKQDLAPGMSIAIDLKGTFTAPGVYKGEFVLVLGGTPPRQHVVPIQITVGPAEKRAAMPVDDHSAKAVALTEDVFGEVATRLAIRMRNTSSGPITVAPAFATVVRIDKADAPTYQIAIPEADAKGPAVVIAAGDVARFDLPVDKLEGAGIYTVEAMFKDGSAAPRYQAQSIKTTVYRRQSGWWAAFAIALGAVLAFLVKGFVSDGSRRLALRRRIALLGEHVRAVRSEARGEQLINAARLLELDIADRDRDARWGNSVNEVEIIVARAEKRLALLRSVMTASDAIAKLDADKQTELREQLDRALVVIRVDPGDDERVREAQEAVDRLAVRGVSRGQLRARLTDLQTLMTQQQHIASPALRGELATIEDSLAAADQLLRGDELDRLGTLIDQKLGSVLDVCIAEVTRLASAIDPPAGVEAADWLATAAEVKSGLDRATGDWKRRNDALLAAEKTYFTTAVNGLIKRARATAASTESRAAELNAMASGLEVKLNTDPMSAAEAYWPGLHQLEAPPHKVVAMQAMTFGDPTAVTSGWIPLLLGAIHDVAAPGDRPGSVALDRKLKTTTWLVTAVVLVIAVASGLKALWLDNLSWGGTSAWVTAFLWGAGVQAAGDACAGIAGLRARLSSADAR
jgi:hypothetical protein